MAGATNINMEEFFEKEEQAFEQHQEEVALIEKVEENSVKVLSKNSFILPEGLGRDFVKSNNKVGNNFCIFFIPIIASFALPLLALGTRDFVLLFMSILVGSIIGTVAAFRESKFTKAHDKLVETVKDLVNDAIKEQIDSPEAYKHLLVKIFESASIHEALKNPGVPQSALMKEVPGFNDKNIVVTYHEKDSRMEFAITGDSAKIAESVNNQKLFEENNQ